MQVYEYLRNQIERGVLRHDDKIPSVLQLQAQYGIATATGQKVHRALRAAGLVRTEPGMGSYVVSPHKRDQPSEEG
ncbi:winged helix-turn-helix domain-containing protein [Spongiactinospora sp. 9N601]|uniref:winged helix-turn-helix domain-containing protein n=1 Tax=Spongiactinospora sp. 9N601 TaxID=3375149 RepID=UPI003788F92E